jgi:hypothetical protein
MRLINVRTFAIEEFIGTGIPPYAILSHTWGSEEVTYQDWQDISRASLKSGFAKIRGACDQAIRDKLEYVWVDTNCIDKTSSAELSEAINSMFTWYRNAAVCYVYLADTPDAAAQLNSDGKVDSDDPFRRSKWFTRGWTLQELLAPQNVVFFSMNWIQLGTKIDFKTPLSQITGIESKYLSGSIPIWLASIAKRMSWMSKRITTRVEDIAYCMVGIFDISMPLLYGEGSRAFLRLQEEILKATDDQSIFCWEWNRAHVIDGWASILAPCPAVFKSSGEFSPTAWDDHSDVVPYSITNVGLSIKLAFIQTANSNFVCGVLHVRQEWLRGNGDADFPYSHQICIPLEKARIHRRLPFPIRPFPLHMAMAGREKNVYIISSTRSPEISRGYISTRHELSTLFDVPNFDVGFLLTFEPTAFEINMPELFYCTQGVLFMETRSLLGFSFVRTDTAQNFAAGIIKLNHVGSETPLVLLAVRLCEDGKSARSYKFYCQVVPQVLVSAVSRGLQLSEIVREVEANALHFEQDVDFSNDGVVTVALGNVIPYSISSGDYRQAVRIVHVVGLQKYRGAALEEDTDLSVSLFSLDGREGFGNSQLL